MKEVAHYKYIGKKIEEHQERGWRLHTYQASMKDLGAINHYLLFERETTS